MSNSLHQKFSHLGWGNLLRGALLQTESSFGQIAPNDVGGPNGRPESEETETEKQIEKVTEVLSPWKIVCVVVAVLALLIILRKFCQWCLGTQAHQDDAEADIAHPLRPDEAVAGVATEPAHWRSTEPASGSEADADPDEAKSIEAAALKEQKQELQRKKRHMMIDAAVRKDKLNKIVQSLADLEAKIDGRPPPTHEDMEKKHAKMLRTTKVVAERGILTSLAYAVPFMSQSKRIYETLEQRVETARERSKQIALEETKNLITDMQSVFNVEDMSDINFDIFSDFELPEFASLIATAFAPAQLKCIVFFNSIALSILWCTAALSVVVIIVDLHASCQNKGLENVDLGDTEKMSQNTGLILSAFWDTAMGNRVYQWFVIDFVVGTFCLLVRLMVWRTAGEMANKLQDPPPFELAGDPLETITMFLDYYVKTGGSALVYLDQILGSRLFFLAQWSVLFDILWLSYGTEIIWNTPAQHCNTLGLFVLRIRSSIFLVLFIPYLIQILGFISGQLMQTTQFTHVLLSIAKAVDEFLGLGLPLTKMLVYAFSVRNSRDMVNIQLHIEKDARTRLQKEQHEAQKILDKAGRSHEKVEREIKRLEEKRMAQRKLRTSEDFRQDYEKRKEELVSRANNLMYQINHKALGATGEANKWVDKWDAGEGPEFLAALARGEGLESLLQYSEQATFENVAQGAGEFFRGMAEDENVQQAVAAGRHMAADVATEADRLAHDPQVAAALARGKEAAAGTIGASGSGGGSGDEPDTDGPKKSRPS